jgi:hypothetical protein
MSDRNISSKLDALCKAYLNEKVATGEEKAQLAENKDLGSILTDLNESGIKNQKEQREEADEVK